MQLPIVLDRRAGRPLHRQIYDQFRQRILSGRLTGGQKMPSTRDLALAAAVSRATVTTAYDQLVAEGYFETARGAGTFVTRELQDEGPRSHAVESGERGTSPAVRLSRYARRLEAPPAPGPDTSGLIDLSRQGPDLEHFPFGDWRRLVARHLRQASSSGFEYAGSPAGHQPLRREIAAYVARSRAVRCRADQVVVVNGSQQALDLCARLLLDEGDEVGVEHPGYGGARQLFAAHGARLKLARLDSEGVRVSDFGRKTRLVHVTPSHQLPTGVSMSLARRLELLEWARSRGAVILEDDYDSEYRYHGAPLPSLQGMAAGTAVVYMGTFSNVMFPGLRLGYLVAPEDLVGPFARAKWLSDRQTPVLEQAALADFIREGRFERHIRRMRRLYKRRREVMVDAIAARFGETAAISGEAAGLHMVVRFAAGASVDPGVRHRVRLTTTRAYYVGEPPPQEFLFSFSGIGERPIREGIRRLAG